TTSHWKKNEDVLMASSELILPHPLPKYYCLKKIFFGEHPDPKQKARKVVIQDSFHHVQTPNYLQPMYACSKWIESLLRLQGNLGIS
ncbi:hypothetical protein ACQP3F_31605, partial [Escherichia coli]